MADTWDDLQALRLRREDLLDLVLQLRACGLEVSPAQLIDVHDLLLGLRLTGQLPEDRTAWGPFLAPVLCRNQADLEIFHLAFPRWVAETQARIDRTQTLWDALTGLAERLHRQNYAPTQEQMEQALGRLKEIDADAGSARARSLLAAPLEEIFGPGDDFDVAFRAWVNQARMLPDPELEVLAAPQAQRRPHALAYRWAGGIGACVLLLALAWFGLMQSPPKETPTPISGLPTEPKDTAAPPSASPPPKTGPTEPLPARPLQAIPPRSSFGWTSGQLIAASAAMPLALFLPFLLWALVNRRLVLTRAPVNAPEAPHLRWVKGERLRLFEPADLRNAGARLREPQAFPTRRIDIRRTVAATVRKAGLYTPVHRMRRRHPEYLVLLDRASLPMAAESGAARPADRDHLAAYGEALIAELRAEQVIIHTYHFDRDPRRCRAAGTNETALDLASLQARHGDCRLLVFSDAGGLFEHFSGRPAAWIDEFRAWPIRLILTPKPIGEWGSMEVSLALQGFAVAPAHPKSLPLLVQLWLPLALQTDVPERTVRPLRLLAPVEANAPDLPALIRRHGDRWLHAEPPEPLEKNQLLDALRHYLGTQGFYLLQVLAVYPELSWPLSLYIDARLNPDSDATSRASRLLRLSRLPWLRHGRIPDYLRLALVRKLPKQHREVATEFYQDLLKALDCPGPESFALEIGPPPEKTFMGKLKAWTQAQAAPLDDRIFAKVILGGMPRWLDVELPDIVARLMPGVGWDDAALKLVAAFGLAVVLGVSAFAGLGVLQPRLDAWLQAQQDALHGSIRLSIVKAPGKDWQEGPLVDALTAGDFAPLVVPPPSAASGKGESPLRPAEVWRGQTVVQVGDGGGTAARWIADRLRYLHFGRESQVHAGGLALTAQPRPESAQARGGIATPDQPGATVQTQDIAAGTIIVWLADLPQVFQDRLDAPPATPPPAVIEPKMVAIPGGTFTMGSPATEKGRQDNEGPQRQVKIAPFAMGVNEVTFDEYDAFAKATGRKAPPDEDWGRGTRPVINVSWDDAQAYAAWLSEKTGKKYRLPTEAEWEYAARAGTKSSRFWGDAPAKACTFGNVADQTAKKENPDWTIHECSDGQVNTAPVGSYKPNAFGLHDTAGNVWEWVQDCYHDSYQGAPSDGSAWEDKGGCDSGQRVLRGGSWGSKPAAVRSAFRDNWNPDDRINDNGFRLARTL